MKVNQQYFDWSIEEYSAVMFVANFTVPASTNNGENSLYFQWWWWWWWFSYKRNEDFYAAIVVVVVVHQWYISDKLNRFFFVRLVASFVWFRFRRFDSWQADDFFLFVLQEKCLIFVVEQNKKKRSKKNELNIYIFFLEDFRWMFNSSSSRFRFILNRFLFLSTFTLLIWLEVLFLSFFSNFK